MTRASAGPRDVAKAVRELASRGAGDVDALCERLEGILSTTGCAAAGESIADGCLRRVIRHAVLLLRSGTRIAEHVDFRPGRLYVERTARGQGQVARTGLLVAAESVPADPQALRGYFSGPCVAIYSGNLRGRVEDSDTGMVSDSLCLSEQDIFEYVENKAASRRYERMESGQDTEQMHQAESEIALAYAQILSDPSCRRRPVTLDSHPYKGPALLVLPRLVKPPPGESVLAYLTSQIRHFRSVGFEAMLLGVVERQSINVYLEERDDGELVPHANTHGYWVSGDGGIDPLLGTEIEYCELAAECRRLGIELIQDTVYATLGYQPQIGRFSSDRHERQVGRANADKHGEWLRSTDFMRAAPWKGSFDESAFHGDMSPREFAASLMNYQRSRPFDLPRPNLFDPRIIGLVRSRTNWLENQAGVRARRIDMAKHLPIRALASIVEPGGDAADAWVLLEWWSSTYQDLRFAASASEGGRGRTYLFDFPLAVAAQDIFLRGHGFLPVVKGLQHERKRWGAELRQLVPTVIDHDKVFMPVFNGTARSSATTVVMHVFATLLSANAPVVYAGFDDARAGVPEDVEYSSYSERLTRRTLSRIVDLEQDSSPARPLAEFLRLLGAYPFLGCWDGEAFEIGGDDNQLVLGRSYWDVEHGGRRTISARFSRAALPVENSTDTLYRHGIGPSVTISLV